MATYEQMEALGARCDVCPLRTEGEGPCSSEILRGTDRIIVSQEPANAEIRADRPFAGAAGRLLDETLSAVGRARYEVSSTNVVACKAPHKGGVLGYESELRRRNRKRESAGKPPIPMPTDCCRPRLHREVAPFLKVFPMGAPAAAEFLPTMRGGIMGVRGRVTEIPEAIADARGWFDDWEILTVQGVNPAHVPGRKVFPTLNPAFVGREPGWYDPFLRDLRDGWLWFDGQLEPIRPRITYKPSIELMEQVLLAPTPPAGFERMVFAGMWAHVFDWETTAKEAMVARKRCLGIGTTEWAMVIPWEPVQWEKERHARRVEAARIRVRLERDGWSRADAIRESHAEAARLSGRDFDLFYTMDDGSRLPLYTREEQAHRDEVVRTWHRLPWLMKLGWNNGMYDRLVSFFQMGVDPWPFQDLILHKRNAQPETPNTLDYAGSYYVFVHGWKGDHTAVNANTDEELGTYNGLDDVVTAGTAEPLVAAVEARAQVGVVIRDHRMQSACVGMHVNGMLVDQEERERLDLLLASPGPVTIRSGAKDDVTGKPLRNPDGSLHTTTIKRGLIHEWVLRGRKILEAANVDVSDVVRRSAKEDKRNAEWLEEASLEEREEADADAGDEVALQGFLPDAKDLSLDVLAFNPFSHPQLRAVLFDVWKLAPPTDLKTKELYTSSGEISTGDAVLRRLYVSDDLNEYQREFIKAIRMGRRHGKVWGTYIRPLRPSVGDYVLDKGSRVWTDGRLHANWNAHTAVTGRFSTSGPNVQNFPGLVKALIIAALGHVLVGADMDQLELRIAAARWGAERYLEAFLKGIDPHQMTMEAVFGRARMMAYAGAPSAFGRKDFEEGSQFEKQRKLAKAIQYASQYAAGCAIRDGRIEVVDVSTVFRLITSAEDKKKGKLLFPNLSERDVAVMHENWLRGCPEFPEGWMREAQMVRDYGCIYEPVNGRRRDFTGARAGKLNEFVNFPIQASAAAIMNDILDDLLEAIPFQVWGPNTGVINQCHDSLTVECPEDKAGHVLDVMTEIMNRRVDAYPGVDFSSEAKVAIRADDPLGRGQSRWSRT